MTELKRKKRIQPVCQVHQDGKHPEYLTFPGFSALEGISHLCSTRRGGVSEDCYESMNLSFVRGDRPEAVAENFRRIAACFGATPQDIICTDQTHTTNIRITGRADAGKGVTRPCDYTDIDGLLTNEPGVILSGYYADCVPLLFADPVKRVIGVAHSGWRGTVGQIGAKMIRLMQETYGTDPSDLHAVIGPSICKDCYEVSADVIDRIRANFPEAYWPDFFTRKDMPEEKYQLDLWAVNRRILLDGGIPENQLEITDLCTCCNPDYLFSHRASHGKRGNIGMFVRLDW